MGFPGGAGSKEPACQFRAAGDEGLIPGSGRSLRGGHGKPLQYSCLGIPWTKELAGYSPKSHKESDMPEGS